MSTLAVCLKEDGYERTEQESPFHDGGMLWSNGHERVCDKTGYVLRPHEDTPIVKVDEERSVAELEASHPTYDGSGRPILPGGFLGPYNWQETEDGLLEY